MKIGKDKYLHFSTCAAITVAVMFLFFLIDSSFVYAMLAGLFASMAAGFGKEYGDKINPYNKWDWKDIIANAAGAVFGILLIGLLYLL